MSETLLKLLRVLVESMPKDYEAEDITDAQREARKLLEALERESSDTSV